ncbi:MAG TPA: tetratricopeptide repeat protein [Burkholderiaceae bacterium]|nr:tetratricopeptide repeat protein [Burkholderiaceae bacterium]
MPALSRRLTAAVVFCGLLALAPPLIAAGGGGGGGDADDPNKKTGPYKDAMDAIAAQRYAQAIPILEKWVAGHSNDADGFNWLGFAYRKTGQLDPAFKAYKRALGIDPQHRGAHEYIGEAYLMANQPDRAEYHERILAQLCPTSCEELKDLREAIAGYRANARPTAKAPEPGARP